jgi:hypothetical protein
MTLYDEEGLLPGFYPNCAIVPGSDDAFLVVSYLSEVPAWFLDTAASDERLKMFLSGSCPAVGAMLRSAEHFEASRGVASFPLLAVLSLDSNVSAPRPWGVVGGAVAGDTRWAPSMEAPFCAAMLDTIGLVGGAETEILGSSEELMATFTEVNRNLSKATWDQFASGVDTVSKTLDIVRILASLFTG